MLTFLKSIKFNNEIMNFLDDQNLNQQLLEEKKEAEERDAQRRAQKFNLTYLNPIKDKIAANVEALKIISEEKAKKGLLAIIQRKRKTLFIALFHPQKPETEEVINELKKEDYEFKFFIVSLNSLNYLWDFYRLAKEEEREISGKIEINQEKIESFKSQIKNISELTKLINTFQSPIISEVLEIILSGALLFKSSDVHIEPIQEKAILRFRIDGMLHIISEQIPKTTYKALTTRIKLLSNLKLNITDQPQDGRFTIDLEDRDIEIRTSVIPSEYGETIVLRVLDPAALKIKLEDLGWRADDLEIIEKILKRPHGLILNTGPTGSGKTTTLYAFLKKLTSPEVKIITIEDPIEYHLEGISQTQVDPEAGYTFASGLRSILRQDPDVILVGEIRDKETAEIALNASLTGHLVFSTLHTNDAVGAIPRLIDLEIKPQILAPALTLVIAQRLVRVLCSQCKIEEPINEELKEKIEKFIEQLPKRIDRKLFKKLKIYKPQGCELCAGIGYKGRTSIFELFVIDSAIEELIYKEPTEIDLKKLARQQGMVTMQEDGIIKFILGITTLEEVERVAGPLSF